MAETRKTASGIIYTLKSCSESIKQEATPAAECRFTLVTPPPVTVKMATKVKPKRDVPQNKMAELAPGGHLCLAQQWLEVNKSVFFGFIWAGEAPTAKRARLNLAEWLKLRRVGLLDRRGGVNRLICYFVFFLQHAVICLEDFWSGRIKVTRSQFPVTFYFYIRTNTVLWLVCPKAGNDVIKNSFARSCFTFSQIMKK